MATTARPLGEKQGMVSYKLGCNGGKAGITNATVALGWLELLNECDADECGFEGKKQGVSMDELLTGGLQPDNLQVWEEENVC